MRFEDWKNENSIVRVCRELLDNTDLDYSFVDSPLSLELLFYVVGSDIKVRFNCKEISKLSIEKENEDLPLHLVLETNVWEKNEDFHIQIFPEFALNIVCKRFDWQIEEFSEKERSEVYSLA